MYIEEIKLIKEIIVNGGGTAASILILFLIYKLREKYKKENAAEESHCKEQCSEHGQLVEDIKEIKDSNKKTGTSIVNLEKTMGIAGVHMQYIREKIDKIASKP